MSTKGATCSAVHEELVDITTCCICDETYRDPKILPCVHTFCLTCLQLTGTKANMKPGDPMPCPICRREFTVPQDGYAALQKNFFMERLVEIGTTKQGSASLCDKHEQENLCLFCSDCNDVLCLACLRESHQNHRLSDLSSPANDLRSQLNRDISIAKRCMFDVLKKKERVAQKKIDIVEKIAGFETEVRQVSSDLKALIDQHADPILQNLAMLRKEIVEDIEIEEKELDKHLTSLENFEKCCAELTSNDRHDSVICKLGRELKEQFVELEMQNKSAIECHLRPFEINFTRTVPAPLEALSKLESGNLIGKVEANFDYMFNPELVATIETNNHPELNGDGISGMTLSNNKVIVINDRSPDVRIYDSDELEYLSRWDVRDCVSDVDLRQCVSVNGTFCIVNGSSREILRINHDNELVAKWSTGNDWGRLSISEASTIVSTCYKAGALREYSLRGTLLHEIKLCSSVIHPLHAIKLWNDHFIVSHGGLRDALNRVCIINPFGDVTKSFGSTRGTSNAQLDIPTCLNVDYDGNVLVLDRNNSRVLLLNSELEFKRELLTKADGLRSPVAMHLDEKTGRLFIADNKWEKSCSRDGKVLVFNVK